MKTKKWLWLLVAVFSLSFYACSDEEGIGYESSPDWATEGGYKILEGINGELTKEAAWKLLKGEILVNTTDFYLPYVSLNILPAKTELKTAKGEIITSPNYKSWVFLIDDTPGGFLSDLKRWIFVKLDGSCITVIKACTINGINDWESILMWDE